VVGVLVGLTLAMAAMLAIPWMAAALAGPPEPLPAALAPPPMNAP
jgi:hypothetical protein